MFYPKPGDGVVKGLRESCGKAAGEGKKPATFSPFRNLLLSFTNADLYKSQDFPVRSRFT